MAKTQARHGQPANYNASPATRTDGAAGGLEVDDKGGLKLSPTNSQGGPSGLSIPAAVGDGRKEVAAAGTAEALAASTACLSVVITAETNNTGVIAVGGSTVVASVATRRGTPLNAGESLALDVRDLSLVYVDSTVNGDGVTYTYVA